jgi:hypothetical protein
MTPAERLNARLDQEEPLLVEAFPTSHLDRHACLVVLPDSRLPAGWSHERTHVAFIYPTNYPAGCPDNVLTRADLRLANGQQPGNNQGVHIYAGRQWLQLSWHIDADAWRPSATAAEGTNLVTYLIGALTRFDEAS